jgi:hypothetical protein
MAGVTVDKNYLEQLAQRQISAANKDFSAAFAAGDIGSVLWLSHGLLCAASNVAVTNAEDARRDAGLAMQRASKVLADKLRAATAAYENTDEQNGEKIDHQVFDQTSVDQQ